MTTSTETTYPENSDDTEVVGMSWTLADIRDMVEEYNEENEGEPLDLEVAFERARRWGRHIADTANTLVAEQLASAIEHDSP